MTIQEQVLLIARKLTLDCGEFAIVHMQIYQYSINQECFTYRQIRNALYRCRRDNEYEHIGRGVYRWLSA